MECNTIIKRQRERKKCRGVKQLAQSYVPDYQGGNDQNPPFLSLNQILFYCIPFYHFKLGI